MKNERVLDGLGLPRLADTLYFFLITKGALSVSELAQSSGKYRPAVYATLAKLQEKNLISRVKKGRRFVYQAVSPKVLSSLLDQELDKKKHIIPEYTEYYDRMMDKARVTAFEGRNGIKQVYELFVASIPKNGVLYRYESPKDHTQIKEFYPRAYIERASRYGDIDKYVITNEQTQKTRRNSWNRLSKSVPKKLGAFDYDVTELISDEKVAFVDYKNKSALLIEDKRFSEFQKKLFQLLFEKL